MVFGPVNLDNSGLHQLLRALVLTVQTPALRQGGWERSVQCQKRCDQLQPSVNCKRFVSLRFQQHNILVFSHKNPTRPRQPLRPPKCELWLLSQPSRLHGVQCGLVRPLRGHWYRGRTKFEEYLCVLSQLPDELEAGLNYWVGQLLLPFHINVVPALGIRCDWQCQAPHHLESSVH